MAIGNRAAIAAILVSGLGLTACASGASTSLIDPKYPTRSAEAAPPARQAQTGRAQSAPPRTAPETARRGGTWKPYQVKGVWYYPAEQPDYDETGIASWYGPYFDGKPTANGETFDMNGLSAAHKTLPLPSMVEVTNLDNGRSMQLRVNDRGPFVEGRIIDLSRGAAEQLGVLRSGVANVRVRYVGPAPSTPRLPADDLQYAAAPSPPRRPDPPKPVFAPEPARPPEPVLPPEPPVLAQAEPAPEPARPAVAARFEIQAGAFSTRANAERAASELAQAGETEIREIDRNGQTLYRVFVRSLTDETAAQDALGKVAASGYRDAVVRRLN